MSRRPSLVLARALVLCISPILATVVSAPVQAQTQTQLGPENHVMSYRLLGTWRSDKRDYIFEAPTAGIGGKSPSSGLVHRQIDRTTGTEVLKGTLSPDHAAGLLGGQVVSPPVPLLGSRDIVPVTAWVDDLGRLWMANGRDPYVSIGGKILTRLPIQVDEAKVRRWAGRWQTNRGTLEVSSDGATFVAWIHRDGGKKERVAFQANTSQATGAWDSEYTAAGVWEHKPVNWGDLSLTLSPDGQSFTGWYSIKKPGAMMGMERREWTGQRAAQSPNPASRVPPILSNLPPPTQPVPQPSTPPILSNLPTTSQPAPQQPAPQQPAPPQPAPTQPAQSSPPVQPAPMPIPVLAAFKPLNRIDVRVDRVVVARGYPTHQVHAFMTVKNTSASPQYFTSGYMKVVLADADGVSWERSQPYRASGEPAAQFSSTPVIQPGGELKVRYIFLSEPDARLSTVTLSEGGKQAQFPVSGL